MQYRLLLALPLLLLAAACAAPPAKGTFTVELTNAGNTPISAGLTKYAGGTRPAPEAGWAAPEDIAMGAPALGQRHWGELIGPGQTKVIGPVEGHFPRGVYAVLRAYVGNPTVDELLAYGRNDPERAEVMIPNGQSSYVITNAGGKLVIQQK